MASTSKPPQDCNTQQTQYFDRFLFTSEFAKGPYLLLKLVQKLIPVQPNWHGSVTARKQQNIISIVTIIRIYLTINTTLKSSGTTENTTNT